MRLRFAIAAPLLAAVLLATGPLVGAPPRTPRRDQMLASAAAQAPVKAAQPAPAKEPEFDSYEVVAPKAVWKEPGKVGRLYGGFTIKQGDTVLRAQEAEYNQTAGTAIATGGVSVTDPQVSVTADRMTVDMNAKKAVLQGAVRVVAKPKQSDAQDPAKQKGLRREFREPVLITCTNLEYYYKQKRAIASGNLRFVQGKRTFAADTCLYFQKQETAVLTGNVQGVDEKGQTYQANAIKLVLKEDDESVEAERFHGVFKVKREEGTEEEPQPPELSEPTPVGEPATVSASGHAG